MVRDTLSDQAVHILLIGNVGIACRCCRNCTGCQSRRCSCDCAKSLLDNNVGSVFVDRLLRWVRYKYILGIGRERNQRTAVAGRQNGVAGQRSTRRCVSTNTYFPCTRCRINNGVVSGIAVTNSRERLKACGCTSQRQCACTGGGGRFFYTVF